MKILNLLFVYFMIILGHFYSRRSVSPFMDFAECSPSKKGEKMIHIDLEEFPETIFAMSWDNLVETKNLSFLLRDGRVVPKPVHVKFESQNLVLWKNYTIETDNRSNSIYYDYFGEYRDVTTNYLKCKFNDPGLLVTVSTEDNTEPYSKVLPLGNKNLVLFKNKLGISVIMLENNQMKQRMGIENYFPNTTTGGIVSHTMFTNIFASIVHSLHYIFAFSDSSIFIVRYDGIDFSLLKIIPNQNLTLPLDKVTRGQISSSLDEVYLGITNDDQYGLVTLREENSTWVYVDNLNTFTDPHSGVKEKFILQDVEYDDTNALIIAQDKGLLIVEYSTMHQKVYIPYPYIRKIDYHYSPFISTFGLFIENSKLNGYEFFVEILSFNGKYYLNKRMTAPPNNKLISSISDFSFGRSMFVDEENGVLYIINRGVSRYVWLSDHKITLSDYGIPLKRNFHIHVFNDRTSEIEGSVVIAEDNERYVIRLSAPVENSLTCEMTMTGAYEMKIHYFENYQYRRLLSEVDVGKRVKLREVSGYIWLLALAVLVLIALVIVLCWLRKRNNNRHNGQRYLNV